MAGNMKANVGAVALVTLLVLLTGCGGGQIESDKVVEGSILNGRPFTMREGGKPVNGTVVVKNAQGKIVKESTFKDGFPNGVQREWYDNGQLKVERQVEYKNQALHQKGVAKVYCENGTLQQDSEVDSDGNPSGKQQTWSCSGKLLSLVTRPFGPAMSAVELKNGDVVVTEEGVHPQGGGWEGEHKRYYNDGKPQLVETWANGKLNGPYKSWDQNGVLAESGTYADGNKVGLWETIDSGYDIFTDYDANNFINPSYADAFMQAIGLQVTNGWASKMALREFRIDPEKIKYYVSQGLVDPKKKLNQTPTNPFAGSQTWTYPYVRASRGALDLLVELGADPKAIDSDRRSRLHYCVYSLYDPNLCSAEEIKRLLGLGLDVNQADLVGNTPLHEVMLTIGNFGRSASPEVIAAVVKVLLDAGADVDALDNDSTWIQQPMSPLMLATLRKQFAVATTMLDHSKKPNQTTSKDGFNLIQLAFLTPDMQQFDLRLTPETEAFVRLAVSKGVDPNAKAGENGSMKDIAERAGAIDLAKFFSSLKAGA